MMDSVDADGKGVLELYTCQGKPDGTECYCPPRIMTCTPRGARGADRGLVSGAVLPKVGWGLIKIDKQLENFVY